MRLEDILDRLRLLGLDDSEATVFVHLTRAGPSKASDVAAAVKLGRTDAYRTLGNLVDRGFIRASLERPTVYTARPVAEVFTDLHAAEQARLENILRIQQEIASALTTLRAPETPTAKNAFRILQGRPEIYRLLERMMSEAERTIDMCSTHPAALSLAETAGTWDAAVRRAEAGARIRVVMTITPAVRERIAAHMRANFEFRHVEPERLVRFIIVDDKQLILWVASDMSARLLASEDVALWTEAPDFVGTHSWLFERVWVQAEPFAGARPVPLDKDSKPSRVTP